ncbi:uncharacterized protein LOC106520942, partial [Austrofundulus limnaeus]|uniref:Uncharacterized protein LOC106520942 n=1 Tax=Austrofundulus limnaeus TaxID=52670 RepID=A0A2I4BLW3_AUSLI
MLSSFLTSGQYCNYYLSCSDTWPTSSLSVLPDEQDFDLCLKDMFDENRADSPDLHPPTFETKPSGVTLPLTAVVTSSRPLTYAEVVRGICQEKSTEPLSRLSSFELQETISSEHLENPSSPTLIEDWFCDVRPISPESINSQGEHRPLCLDSPVPQFRCSHIDCIVDLSSNRSFTPESKLSDWEETDLCLEVLFDENRPESPQSVVSDYELDKLFSYRALSPDSVSSGCNLAPFSDWLSDLRASSPESVASNESPMLSSFLTFGQHCNYFLSCSDTKPTSPLSMLSDEQDFDLCLKDMFNENRADSPDSLPPTFEAKHSGENLPLPAVVTSA